MTTQTCTSSTQGPISPGERCGTKEATQACETQSSGQVQRIAHWSKKVNSSLSQHEKELAN